MAKKAKPATDMPAPASYGPSKDEKRRWEVEDALSTVRRAAEIIGNTKLLREVTALANERAVEMRNIGKKAEALAKMGRISDKAMAKLKSKSAT